MKTIAIKETCVAGRTIEHILKLPGGSHKGSRKSKSTPSRDAVIKNNDRIAERNARRIINANFGPGDGHYTLTYGKNAPNPEDAKRHLANFLDRMKRALKKLGHELKYFAVTEYDRKRIHHHVILNTDDAALVNRIWGKGWTKVSLLDKSGDYSQLANYLLKETQRTFREDGSPQHKRYTRSRNLIVPPVKRETVSVSELFEDPKPIPGYYIPKDSVRRYTHPITGMEHIEYIEIALKEPRSYRVWPRGRIVKPEGKRYPPPEDFDIEEGDSYDL